ncbi:UNVERIFIED_CONTAM: hypothetical protein FKN15_012852 [Acipenser sinensis]
MSITNIPLSSKKAPTDLITEEEAVVAVALFPSLNELVIRGNPLTTQKSGMLGYLNTKQEAAESQKVSDYKPIPPIPAPPQGKGEETQEPEQDPESYWDRMPGEEQEKGKLTTDDQNVEAFFMTQVNDHPKSDKEEVLESKKQNLKQVSVPDKYKGFEELLDARPDPEFIEPVAGETNNSTTEEKQSRES